MFEADSIQGLVARTGARRRGLRAWNGLWRGLLVGGVVFLTVLVACKLAPLPGLALPVAGAVWALAGAAGWLAGFLRSTSAAAHARWLDAHAGLQDRISTALEVGSDPKASPEWRVLVLGDAARAAAAVDPRRLAPYVLPRQARLVALIAAAAMTLAFVPEYRSPQIRRKALEAAIIRDVGTNLARAVRKDLDERPPSGPEARRQLDAVGELGDKLASAKLTRDDALAELAKAADALGRQSEQLARDPVLRRMEAAARRADGSSSATPPALRKQIEALREALGKQAAEEPEALAKLKDDLERLRGEAEAMGGDNSAKSPTAQTRAAEAVAELARRAEALGLDIPGLGEAMAALKAAQVERFLKGLEQATRDLEKAARQAAELADLRRQASGAGKDLAEQLGNGEAEAAMRSLERMADTLRRPGASEAERRQVAEELSKALGPASKYGKVGEHLDKASKKAGGGDPAGSARSMADARDELKRMLDDMNDARQMMAALGNIDTARMAVGNNCPWGQCQGNRPGGKPAGGNGGKGGRGVGTWSDNNAWAMPDHFDDTWDNSGVNRPDGAGRGTTERDTSRPDGLTPTKVRGQMQPGGPMPSIPLPGLGIRGSSKVAYSEAVTAAQEDARAALAEEQVPRAYRGAVRDYFDDLKK